MSNVRFDELELMLMAMFEQPTLKDTIQVLMGDFSYCPQCGKPL